MNRKQRVGLGVAIVIGVTAAVWLVPSITTAAPRDHADHAARVAEQAKGDPLVQRGLIRVTAALIGQQPAQVREQLADGQSIASIAQAAGKSDHNVLAAFGAVVDQIMARAVARGRLPQSVADSRAAWFKQSARVQINQPGLDPAFPGLHELHVVTISAAVRVSGITRSDVRAQLETCRTLDQIVLSAGKTSADVVAEALANVDQRLQAAVDADQITAEQRDEWRAAIEAAVTKMATTPGLHVAGKECAS